MPLQFFLKSPPQGTHLSDLVVLILDDWDDFSFKTAFIACIYDDKGEAHEIGPVKIGYFGQQPGRTSDTLPPTFLALPDNYFSLGQEPEYYERLRDFPEAIREEYLRHMKDLVFDSELRARADDEQVFATSLLRSVSRSAIDGQFKRILSGGAALTEFRFYYTAPVGDRRGPMELAFEVIPTSRPPTNIHVVIGRNGVGKTTLLNAMAVAIVEQGPASEVGAFSVTERPRGERHPMPSNYFSSVTSVAFSAFDPFKPPADRTDRSKGVSYIYVGLKRRSATTDSGDITLKPLAELSSEFAESLKVCLSTATKRRHWRRAIRTLEFDQNFADMNLSDLADGKLALGALSIRARELFAPLSSGHKIVLLTITRLVETVEEKSLILLDEPESHLHPPLLSAFTRALSELLTARNAVAIVATHSPVVLQEVPQSCVWKIARYGSVSRAARPEIETFGENVGSLTREIFGLDVSKSGFHDLLAKEVASGQTFEQILSVYDDQLGLEGQAVLRALLASGNG
jgi:predicted ATPase